MAKRGFSKMMWGGGIILVAVLFFVSVYGVREGFKTTNFKCEKGTVLDGPSLKRIESTQNSDNTYSYSQKLNCFKDSCKNATESNSNKGTITCYSGTVQNNTNDITQAGLTARTYTPIAAESPDTGYAW